MAGAVLASGCCGLWSRSSCISPIQNAASCRTWMKLPSRREFGIQLLLVPVISSSDMARASDVQSAAKVDPSSWDEYVGNGFAVKVPPGFEDTIEPDEYPAGGAPLYGYRPKSKVFAARFASSDGEEFVSVIIRRTSQLKPTFFEAKSITDIGKVDDIANLFLPVGARLTGASSITSTVSETKRVYYLYEYLAGNKHVFLSASAKNGQVYIAAASAPQSKWKKDGAMLSSAAVSFSVL